MDQTEQSSSRNEQSFITTLFDRHIYGAQVSFESTPPFRTVKINSHMRKFALLKTQVK